MMSQTDCDKAFENALVDSYGGSFGLTVSKIKPNGNNSRSIWNDDKEFIMKSSKKYGFEILMESKTTVTFIKSKK